MMARRERVAAGKKNVSGAEGRPTRQFRRINFARGMVKIASRQADDNVALRVPKPTDTFSLAPRAMTQAP